MLKKWIEKLFFANLQAPSREVGNVLQHFKNCTTISVFVLKHKTLYLFS